MQRRALILIVVLMALTLMSASAQTGAPTSDRKVATRVTAAYPDLAKKMHIHGAVRVEAIVRPNGTVKSTRVLGGNPVLVTAAQDAVSQWRFEPAQAETTEVVQLVFESQ
jgi:TonB family protein